MDKRTDELLRENGRLRAELRAAKQAAAELGRALARLEAGPGAPDSLMVLREMKELAAELETIRSKYVRLAISQGLSYAEIGRHLDMHRQAVSQRYGSSTDPTSSRPAHHGPAHQRDDASAG